MVGFFRGQGSGFRVRVLGGRVPGILLAGNFCYRFGLGLRV